MSRYIKIYVCTYITIYESPFGGNKHSKTARKVKINTMYFVIHKKTKQKTKQIKNSKYTNLYYHEIRRGRHGRERMVIGFTSPMQSVPITTDVVSSNLNQGEVYNIM